MAITDYITIAAFLYFFFSGAQKGFLRTVLGPLSFVAGCFVGYAYYERGGSMVTSLGICMFGPFVIYLLASILLNLLKKSADNKPAVSSISRISGSVISLLWGGSYLALMLLLIGIIPLKAAWFQKIQNDVLASRSYATITSRIGENFSDAVPDVKRITSILEDPERLAKFQSTEEFTDLYEDEGLRELVSDEEIAELIEKRDYAALLSNPKMQGALQNEELLKKIFALNKKIMEDAPEPPPAPKVIEVEP